MPRSKATIDYLLELLTVDYVYVKEAIIWLTAYSRERSKRAVHELKDALDHIAISVQDDISEEDALMGLHAAKEHFRRAAVEPTEWIALEELQRLLIIKEKGFWWWKFLLLKAPDSREFNNRIKEGIEYIIKGRHFKGISVQESFENLKQGYEIFHQLLEEVEPGELRSRVFSLRLSLVMALLGVSLGAVVSWWISCKP